MSHSIQRPFRFAALVASTLFGVVLLAGDLLASSSVKDLKLSVSPNGRHLIDQHGKPFFYLGDTCWLLFQRLTREEVDEYLKDRASKGFTVVQAYVLRGLGEEKSSESISGRNRDGETALVERDPTRLNEAFFKNVDHVINRANELGLVMGLVTSKSWHVNEHPERVFNTANAYTFGKLLAERYRQNAVLWYVGGDSAPGKDSEVWEAMARGHKDGSGGRHLVSYHGHGQTSSSQWFHRASWLDFNSIQSGHGWAARTDRWIAKDYALEPIKPTLDMEPPYENHPTGKDSPRIDSHQVRKGAYWAMLSGAAGHGYGALDLFHLYREDQGSFPRDGFQPWRRAIAYEGSRQVGYVRRLFEQVPWQKLVPDQSVIASGEREGEEHAQAARTEDGSFVVAYLPQGLPIGIRMDKLAGSKVRARWFNPREGAWHDQGGQGELAASGVREFSAPSQGPKEDWVLVLDSAAERRLLYAAVPGVRDYLEYGGHGLLVFDIDQGHKLLKRIPTGGLGDGGKPLNVKGVCASAVTKRIYISTIRTLQAIDLASEKLLWERAYEGGCDRMALSPDGSVIYLPSLEKDHWHAVDAGSGDVIARVVPSSGAHNTVYGADGRWVYLAGLKSPVLSIADTREHKIARSVGPFGGEVRPFTVNGKQTLCFVNVNRLLGFEVGDITSGKALHRVEVKGFSQGPVKRHGCPSHGIGLTPDERELWVTDAHNRHVHIFDATLLPPRQLESIKLRDEPGWVTFTIDGQYAYPSTGDVIDVKSRKIVAGLKDEAGRDVQSEKMLEIDFRGTDPVRAGDQFGVGRGG